jgi:putative endonuclease
MSGVSKKEQGKTSYYHGKWAEFFAILFLKAKLYRIIGRRVKTPVGEIDIIAMRGEQLAFIEVKMRNSIDSAISSLSHHQQRRLERASNYYMSGKERLSTKVVRFDLIALAPFRCPVHIKNAWEYNSLQ